MKNRDHIIFAFIACLILFLAAVGLIWNSIYKVEDNYLFAKIFPVTILLMTGFWASLVYIFKMPMYAFIQSVTTLVALVALFLYFYFIIPTAGFLLIPYIVWSGFVIHQSYFHWKGHHVS